MLELIPQEHENPNKLYVYVWTQHSPSGEIIPLAMKLRDKTYRINKVLDVRPKASRKIGGAGIRYLCRIENEEIELYLEDKRWFIEARPDY